MDQAEYLAQKQLDAYNAKDIEAFLSCYHDDVQVYDFPNDSVFSGKNDVRQRYATLFETYPEMEARLVNRMVCGDVAIDHEEVRRERHDMPFFAIAIYTIRDDKIAEVRFIK